MAILDALAGPLTADLNPWIGAARKTPSKYPTFEFTLAHIAFALAPWSGFAPFALGRLWIAPLAKTNVAFARESDTRVALLAHVPPAQCFMESLGALRIRFC